MPDRLEMRRLEVRARDRMLLDGVHMSVEAGEILALVGESGSGKTLTARSLLGLPGPRPGIVSAELLIQVDGCCHRPYAGLGPAPWSSKLLDKRFKGIRGAVVGYLPQDARGGLDPLWTVQRLVAESITLGGTSGEPADWLRRAGFDHPAVVQPLYPHQLSGGMAQRVSLAMTMARGSRFIVADEPSTGLDPTVRNGILAEIRKLADDGVGVILITHDLRLVSRLARRVVILHQGKVLEEMAARELSSATSTRAREMLLATARISGGSR